MKFTLRRVHLNGGGYTDRGQYFGTGAPLYWYQNDTGDEDVSDYIRAYDRDDAKTIIRAKVRLRHQVEATFYR